MWVYACWLDKTIKVKDVALGPTEMLMVIMDIII